MNFNITYDSATVNATSLGSAANLNAFEAQINAAAALYASVYLDPVTVNFTVKYAPVGLGQTLQSYYAYSAATVQDALKKDETSLDDLKTSNAYAASGTVYLTHAQLKALGLIAADSPGSDATITFDNTPGLLDFTHSSSMSSTSYDLYGVAAHEISEVMGRVADLKTSSGTVLTTPLSAFNTGGNFTIGSESLLKFNTAATGDRGDWDSSVPANDAFRAFGSPGVVSQVSPTDLRAVDVVGWDHKAMDLVLAIDTTGSMGPYIANVQANAVKIVNAAFGTDAAPDDTRIGIVGFKDAAGPNGPGENFDLLNFTQQDTYDARKTAAINAINSITVGGGGDIPEGDNSALLYALQGNLGDWRRAAQDHKIVLFTDAPIKDTGLAGQVADAATKLGVTVTSGSISSSAGVVSGSFTFSAPSSALLTLDATDPRADSSDVDSVLPGPTPETITFSTEVFVIQVGSDPSATPSLQNLANSTGGQYLTGDATNLADIIAGIVGGSPTTSPTISNVAPGTVEKTQTTVIATVKPGTAGDTLTLNETAGTGTLSLGPVQPDGTQQVIYTAPASIPTSTTDAVSYTVKENGVSASGMATVQLDSGPSITLLPFAPGAANKAIAIATAAPGLPTDTLSLVITKAPQSGTVSLQGNSVQFTPANGNSSTPITFSFDVKDELGGVTPTATVIAGGPNTGGTVTGNASGNTDVSLGRGASKVTLGGSGNVVDAGDGQDTVTGGTSNNTIILGNGSNTVNLSGGNNTITLGNGSNTVSVGGSANQIKLGGGIEVVHGGSGDTITLAGFNNSLTLYGSKEMVFLAAGTGSSIDDLSQGMTLVLSGNPGTVLLKDFAKDPSGIIDLKGGLGKFTTPQAVVAALQSDHNGGTLLSLGGANQLDFVGVAASQLHSSNFQIG